MHTIRFFITTFLIAFAMTSFADDKVMGFEDTEDQPTSVEANNNRSIDESPDGTMGFVEEDQKATTVSENADKVIDESPDGTMGFEEKSQ